MTVEILDQAKVQAFAGKLIGVLNDAALALMTSIGHQTSLFDVMASLPPATPPEIAQVAGLHERYVREWLGAMTVGGVIEHDSNTGTYRLPPEHATWLTRDAGTNNLATQMQFIPLLGSVEPGIVESFRNGGGVPYAEYPRFQRVMGDSSAMVHDSRLIDTILPLVSGLPERLRSGIEALDIGCGQGHAVNLMAKTYPSSNFRGYDISEQGIATARKEAGKLGIANAEFTLKDLATMDEVSAYDLITAFDVIHDQAKPAHVLDAVFRALKPNGVFLMVDVRASSHVHDNIDHPLGPFLYTVSTMHCMTVSLAQHGEGLGTVWGEQKALQMLANAGFKAVEVHQVEGDIVNNYYICRKT